MATGKTGVVIPTGYEQFQRAAEEKRQIAKAMLAQGMQPLNNPTSWAQVLGQWAQSFAGNRMLRQADSMDDKTNALISGDYTRRTGELNQDAANLTPEQFVPKYASDPMLREHPLVKAMIDVYTANQKKRFEPEDKPKPGDLVIPDGHGGMKWNGVAIGARRAAGGFDSSGWPQSQAAPELTPEALMAGARMAGQGTAPPAAIGTTRPPDGKSADGRDVWLINGQYYDNPEGK